MGSIPTPSELHTLVVGLLALGVGIFLNNRVPAMRRLGLPISVVGGVLVSIVVLLLYRATGIEIGFATGARDVLLLAFFTTVGLSAKLSQLRDGGRPLAILCGVVVLLLVLQDAVGVAIAVLRGAHPFYGLLAGSLSFVGGPGTAIAWAVEGEAMGLEHATAVALGAATLATLAGALVATPLTGLLIRRRGLSPGQPGAEVPWLDPETTAAPTTAASTNQIILSALLIVVAVAIGAWLNDWARSAGVLLPGFLTAMLGGVVIANLFDLLGVRFAFDPVERAGGVALQLFLVLSLMGLQLWTIGDAVGPLLLNLVIQVALTAAIAFLVLFRLLGRDYDAALTVGGFMGFGLASMPVAFATMEELASRHGPSPKAFLLITLAASFFVDLANATVTKLVLALPLFD